MKVLILHDRISERGGSDRYILSVLDALHKQVETLLVVAQDDLSLADDERSVLGKWVRIKNLDRRGFRPKGLQATLKNLKQTIVDFNPDIVHVHNVVDPDVMTVANDSAPTVMTVQDHRVFCPGQGKIKPNDHYCDQTLGKHCLSCFRDDDYGSRIIELTRQRLELTKAMDRVVVLSQYMADELIAGGMDDHRIAIIRPYVHRLQPAKPALSYNYHLLAGRLVRRKGINVAIEAAHRLNNSIPLVIAGDGPMADKVAEIAAASDGRIIYLGWIHRKQGDITLPSLIAGATSMWVPSLWAEPFGLIGPEAMSMNVPVVGANIGGIPEWLIDEKSGYLVRPGKANALAKAADRLSANTDRASEMGLWGAHDIATRFNRTQFVDGLMSVYKSCL